jgi:hypothetical protein
MWEQMVSMENPMIQYVRQGKNKSKNGVLLAGLIDDTVCIGWSLCNKKDVFDLEKAVILAEDRCYLNFGPRFEKYLESYAIFDLIDVIPQSIHKDMFYFLNRIYRYYKNNEKSNVVKYLDENL